jgi:outer membrane protein assembly factor BamB
MLTVGQFANGSRTAVIVASRFVATAFDADSGQELWRSPPIAASDPGAVWNGMLLLPGGNATYALDLGTGAVMWKNPYSSWLLSVSSDGVIYTTEGLAQSGKHVVAMNASTGSILWMANGTSSGYYGNPVALPTRVCAGLNPVQFVCYNRTTGATLGKAKFVGPAPAIADSGVLFLETQDDFVVPLEPSTFD